MKERTPMWLSMVVLVWSTLSGPAHTAQPKLPASAECRADLAVTDRDRTKISVRVRASCPLTREQLTLAFADLSPSAFADGARPDQLNVDLGRIAEHPWLSSALANAALHSKEWDRRQGKPRQRNINQFVAALLRVSGTLDGIVPGWDVREASVEKVLVKPTSKISGLPESLGREKALAPYDGILSVRLTPRQPLGDRAEMNKSPATINPPARLDE